MRWTVYLIALLSLFCLQAGAQAQAKTFKIEGDNKVQFVSEATLETFTGASTQVAGSITADPAALASAKADVRVEVASIRTGIDLRDDHLRRDNWLDAARFPTARLELVSVAGADKLAPNAVTELTVKGKFTIHGVTRPVTVKTKVRYTPATDVSPASLHILGSFKVKLEDHGVSIPAIVALKVAPVVDVNVDLHAVAHK